MVRFTDRQYDFLQQEFGFDRSKADSLSEDELYELSDRCFDIELEGDLEDGSKMPDRCGIAGSIVDSINAMQT